jgi:TetR/AcrR family transcriptional regulator
MAKTKKVSKQRDAELTKKLILDAAEAEFARSGLLGARTEDMAVAADCTRAMIHYYFDSKETLYRLVLERLFAEQAKVAQGFDVNQATPKEALESFMRIIMTDLKQHRNIPLIVLFEGIQNQGKYYKQIVITAIYEPIKAILERGIKEGAFRSDMNTLHTAINIVGACIFYTMSRNNLTHMFDGTPDILDKELYDVHVEEALKLIIGGVSA